METTELNELEMFLSQTVSPERAAVIIQGADLLIKANYTTHEYPIKVAMMGIGDADAGTIVQHISEIVLESLKRLLQLSSIFISQDTSERDIPTLCDIVTTLMTAVDELDSSNILLFVDRDDDPKELLAEIVSLMSDSPIEVVSSIIDSCHEEAIQGFIETLRQEVEKREDSMISFTQLNQEKIRLVVSRLRKYMTKYNPSFAKRLVISGFELGLNDVETYTAVMAESEELILLEKGAEFVQEYIGIMLLTDKTPEDILSLVADDIQEMQFTDPNESLNASTWLRVNKDNILALLQEG